MIYVGIDVGGTGIQVGLVDESGKILCKGGIVTRTDIPFDMQVKAMADCVLDTIDKGGYTLGDVKAIGAGVPGVTDPRTGNIAFCTNLGWVDVPFVQEFNKHIAKPVFVGNDATVAGLAESVAGVSAGSDSSVFITLGTGVGGGIVFNGKVWNGFHGVGSEIGHMILELDGEPCTCGNYGCVERYCSATAIIRMARELCAVHPESEIVKVCEGDLNRVNAKVVFDAAKNGDKIALKVFHRYVKYLGQLVASLVNCIDPEVIVLGGGVSKAGDFLLDAVRAETRRYVLYKTLPSARIELAKLGPDVIPFRVSFSCLIFHVIPTAHLHNILSARFFCRSNGNTLCDLECFFFCHIRENEHLKEIVVFRVNHIYFLCTGCIFIRSSFCRRIFC